MFVRTLSSMSSTVKLLRMKNRSFWACAPSTGEPVVFPSVEVAADALLPAASTPSASLAPDGSGVGSGCGADAAGPVGAVLPVGPSTVLLRSRLTSLTVRNLESWSLRWAAMLAASSLKLAKAQLLLDMRNRDSSPSASLHTWCTRPMRSVCGGRFPIQIACPVG